MIFAQIDRIKACGCEHSRKLKCFQTETPLKSNFLIRQNEFSSSLESSLESKQVTSKKKCKDCRNEAEKNVELH